MDVWYAIPTVNLERARVTLAAWRRMGYRTAILVDPGCGLDWRGAMREAEGWADWVVYADEYRGYPCAVKRLCNDLISFAPVFTGIPAAEIIVTGGDDILPDPDHEPGQIAAEFIEHFGGTYGVMQPTGDRWMSDKRGQAASERICGSPWMGREFIERINGGRGPFWHEYFHFYCDEEMKEVADRLGILWQRRDLCQKHDHWTRPANDRHILTDATRPEYLKKAHYECGDAAKLFRARKAAGFPGHEPKDI